ncbi:MAG: hypothetical protein QXV61_00120 [Archaeoglobaceae archaeon]
MERGKKLLKEIENLVERYFKNEVSIERPDSLTLILKVRDGNARRSS